MGVIPIIVKKDFSSCANIFIPNSIELNYGDCSTLVVRVVVASDFAKLPVALDLERGQEEFTDFVLCGIASKIRKKRVRSSPFTLKRFEDTAQCTPNCGVKGQ